VQFRPYFIQVGFAVSLTYNSGVKERRIISVDPDVMGGTACFAGTRVPVQTLLDYLRAGESIDDFLEGFPTVKREQVLAFMEEAKGRQGEY
jgi:uncharacterized protein (DUF433 family)